MKQVVAVWRSLDGSWELVKLYECPPSGEGGMVRHKAVEEIGRDIGRWTLPVSYRITTETLEGYTKC